MTAHRGHRSITAPAAPTPPARFHIIGESQAKLLREVEAAYPQSHLLLGILNMQAGAVGAATRHLKDVKPDAPYADVARRALYGAYKRIEARALPNTHTRRRGSIPRRKLTLLYSKFTQISCLHQEPPRPPSASSPF